GWTAEPLGEMRCLKNQGLVWTLYIHFVARRTTVTLFRSAPRTRLKSSRINEAIFPPRRKEIHWCGKLFPAVESPMTESRQTIDGRFSLDRLLSFARMRSCARRARP